MKYIVEVASYPKTLQREVQKRIVDGYEPLGGVSVALRCLEEPGEGKPATYLFAQALIKRED
jgi:hypothetical protein